MNTTSTLITTIKTSTETNVAGLALILLALGMYFSIVIGLLFNYCHTYTRISPAELRGVLVYETYGEAIIKDYMKKHKYATDEVCNICLENKNMLRTDCYHIYCDECLEKWMVRSNTCPVCRAEF